MHENRVEGRTYLLFDLKVPDINQIFADFIPFCLGKVIVRLLVFRQLFNI